MKKWLVITVLFVLLASTAVNGYLSWRLNDQADFLNNRLTSLEGSLSLVNASTSQLACDLATHCELVTATVSLVRPFVARIDVTGDGFTVSGSGIIVSSGGYLVTNDHVVSGAATIKVTLVNGERFDASVVASDPKRDLAVLKLASDRSDFAVATLGTSAGVVIGSEVMVAGFPLGSDLDGPATFTRGIVSAIRHINGLDFVQTDAAINPGNSGGCLVTLDGKVVGIIVAMLRPPDEDVEGISLAIPIDEVLPLIKPYTGG